jgi:hypothetical protein
MGKKYFSVQMTARKFGFSKVFQAKEHRRIGYAVANFLDFVYQAVVWLSDQ